jgi:hypothetical protein
MANSLVCGTTVLAIDRSRVVDWRIDLPGLSSRIITETIPKNPDFVGKYLMLF